MSPGHHNPKRKHQVHFPHGTNSPPDPRKIRVRTAVVGAGDFLLGGSRFSAGFMYPKCDLPRRPPGGPILPSSAVRPPKKSAAPSPRARVLAPIRDPPPGPIGLRYRPDGAPSPPFPGCEPRYSTAPTGRCDHPLAPRFVAQPSRPVSPTMRGIVQSQRWGAGGPG